jgi:hypothetical protein
MVMAIVNNNPQVQTYYRTFTSNALTQNGYYPTLQSVFSNSQVIGNLYEFELNKGPESYLNLQNFTDYFNTTDSIYLKINTMGKSEYTFWMNYQSEIINDGNPFATSYHTVTSNIRNGLGIWGAYGSAHTYVRK